MSMAIFGTIGVFTRLIPLSSSEIALYRAVLAAIVIALFLALSKKKVFQGIKNKTLVLLFLSGAAMGFNWILLFEAYNYTSLTAATLSYYFAPTIVLLSSPIVMKERLKKKEPADRLQSRRLTKKWSGKLPSSPIPLSLP